MMVEQRPGGKNSSVLTSGERERGRERGRGRASMGEGRKLGSPFNLVDSNIS